MLSDNELIPQDENDKRPNGAVSECNSSAGNGESVPTPSKVPRVLEVIEAPDDPVKQKEQTSHLEDLVSKLKVVRKPLKGAVANAKLTDIDTVAMDTTLENTPNVSDPTVSGNS